MAYTNTIKAYLKRLQEYYKSAQSSGQYTAELSFRPALNELLENLAIDFGTSKDIDVVLEPKNQGKMGRPDWRIHDKKTLGIFGFVEAKGLSEVSFDISPYIEQIQKYLTLKHKLIITDGIDFVFCLNENQKPSLISLIDKNKMLQSKHWENLEVDSQFQLLMSQFYANPSPQYCSETQLVELVALRTKLLANEIYNYAEIPIEEAIDEDEKNTISLLSSIYELVYNHNDSRLRNGKVFSDFTAQVIMFSLLYAHRALCKCDDIPIIKEKIIREFISKDLVVDDVLMPFRNLMIFLCQNSSTDIAISQWIDECIRFLSFVKMTDTQLINPDYHKLFELFLSKYDAQVRFDYGAYYTPANLAEFVVKLSEKVANDFLDGSSIYCKGNTIIDPCCGTGSFLEKLVVNDTKNEEYNLCGFEIMPTPYMLANYRMTVVNKQYEDRLNTVSIILANTLCNGIYGKEINEKTIEGQELKRANKLANLPLKLIIGNPPCSDSSRQNISEDFSIINNLMEDFRPPIEERHGRQNVQKQVNNPFMLFIRWSCEHLLKSENNSILSFVVPLSFLEAESYKYARKYLCENFSQAWIVAIDADARTGVRNNSLFHTLQGRAIIVLEKKYLDDSSMVNYNYLDISAESVQTKNEFLRQNIDDAVTKFKSYDIDSIFYSFVPSKEFDNQLYDMFWPVSGTGTQVSIFMNHCSGIKLAPTAIFTHVKETMLKRRTKDLATGQDISAWFIKQDRKPEKEKIEALKSALNNCGDKREIDQILSSNIKTYSFRPFLQSKILLWEDVLKKYATVGGGGTRLRPEIIKTYSNRETLGFAMAHAPKDLNPTLSQFVSFCWYYPDNDMCSRGNSHIYMNLYQTKKDNEPKSNINFNLIEFYQKLFSCTMPECERMIVFYVYGIMCSQLYLDEFEGALFTLNHSDDRARVPFVKNATLFKEIAKLGQKLAELEKEEHIPENLLEYDYNLIMNQIPEGFHLENSSKSTPFNEEKEVLNLSDGQISIPIYCPLELQHLNISGYDVIKNVWLKFYSYDFTHCDFSKDDMRKTLDFLNTLQERAVIVNKMDLLMEQVLRKETEFFTTEDAW